MIEYLERQEKLTGNQWRIIATAERRRHARFLRLLPDRLRAGLHPEGLAPDLRPVGADPDLRRPRCRPGAFFWGWMGDRIGRRTVFILTALNVAIATGVMYFTPGRGRVGRRLDLPVVLPLLRRLRQCRADRGRYPAGAGIRALLQARLGQRADHRPAASRQHSGSDVRSLPGADHRLARAVPRRPGSGAAGADDPLLGAGIAALADAHGADRRGAQVARLGACRCDPKEIELPTSLRGDGKDVVARAVPVSAQHDGGLPRRAEPDRRRRYPDVDHALVRDGAQDHPGRRLLSDDLRRRPRHHRAARSRRGCRTRSGAACRVS